MLLVGLVALVGFLASVAPNPEGRGTHPQLFAPCPVGVDGPIRCPTCGLTSGSAALLRGDVLGSVRRHLLAPLLLALVFGGIAWLAVDLVQPRLARFGRWGRAYLRLLGLSPFLATFGYFLMQVFR